MTYSPIYKIQRSQPPPPLHTVKFFSPPLPFRNRWLCSPGLWIHINILLIRIQLFFQCGSGSSSKNIVKKNLILLLLLKIKIKLKMNSVAEPEPVELKLFETWSRSWSRSRNYIYFLNLLQKVWRLLTVRKTHLKFNGYLKNN